MLLSSPAQLNYLPKRIISLVPSLTELLYDAGLDEQIIGITKFCVHPPGWKKEKAIIGGTKNVNAEKIKALAPDLIIANKEENVKEQVEALAADHTIYVTDINTLQDALDVINNIGLMTSASVRANQICSSIKEGFAAIEPINNIPAAYFIWRKPYMTVGGDTFIHDLLSRCGFQNIYAPQSRYPAVDIEYLTENKCKLLLLSSEPYPFKQQHIDELQQLLPHTKIILADGEMFSWYGSRLLHSPAYFSELLKSVSQFFTA